ncbi:lysostaphin resistance A-like protein [Chryseobacterium sp. M5]|uniref:CPBP family intramembrane glutamic endopeptidase n=1 Tax=Chryseobacterium sp. M5 TaxID=3379128 RepID=UPI003857614C
MGRFNFFVAFIFGFGLYFYFDQSCYSYFHKEASSITKSTASGHILAYLITLIPLLITVLFLKKKEINVLEAVGLSGSLTKGFGFAFLCTLPLLVAFSVKFSLNTGLSLNTIIINTISSAFFEEIIYRAFLFGILYRCTRLGFLPSVFLGSLLFGVAHLYQATDFVEILEVFAITFLGSVFFCWIYAEWNFNLWTAIFLHCLMNLYWLIFNVDDSAIGGMYANIFRFLSFFIAIGITIFYKRRNKISLEVTKTTFCIKPKDR